MVKNVYKTIRNIIPIKYQGKLTYFLYLSGIKPRWNKQIKSPLQKGIIVFSADFEMAWAFRYSKKQKQNAVKLGLRERFNIPVLVNLFEKYNIPVTWATVGHLFLKSCNKKSSIPHPEMLRPDYFENKNWNYSVGDWYDSDPCTNYEKDPAWYAPDLIENIINSKVNHEIGCHTFSHIDFSDKNCNDKLAEAELIRCIQLASDKGINMKSIVFPGGTLGNLKTVSKYGFITYRKPMKYDVDIPVVDDHGLVMLPSSFGLDKDPYGWNEKTHLSILKKYIDVVNASKQVCHFWFHPSMNEWYLKNVFPSLLKLVNQEREKGNIDVKTMAEVAEMFKSE